jgi:uncharacterized protein
MDLWLIFLTGLTVGGLTCLAVQGGLLTSVIAAREDEDFREGSFRKHSIWPILSFIITKLIVYSGLGFLLGAFGSALSLSDTTRIIMQLVAGLYMIIIALDIFNVHPIFRYALIQPPRFLTQKVRGASKSKDVFAPALLGALTVLIPCGTTLAMEVLAISSGSALMGALIMFVFILGTSPLFFVLGLLTTSLGDKFRGGFLKLAGILVFYLGIISLNGALVLAGSPISLQSIPISIDLSAGGQAQNPVKFINGIQEVNISVYPTSYSPAYFQVKQGVPVKMNLQTFGGLGCTSEFRVPQLGISKDLPLSGAQTVEFTPQETGKIVYTCSMGMYSGVIEVI